MSSRFLLDTNVASEPSKQRPDLRVVDCLIAQPADTVYLSVVSIGEVRKGIELLSQGNRRIALEHWLETDLLVRATGRIFPVTQQIADRWGLLTAKRQLVGSPLGLADGLIAATALEHNLVLATRNTMHFLGLDLPLLNPWEDQPQIM